MQPLPRGADPPLPTLRALQSRGAPLPPRVFAQLHALLLTSGHAHHSPHLAALLRLCCPVRFRLSHRLRLLLHAPLPAPTTFLANSLLLAAPLHLPSALALYSLLFLLHPPSLRPNAFTFRPLLRAAPLDAASALAILAVIGACGELGALGHGVWAHAYVLKRRLAVNCFVATALVEMYARCGRLDLADQVFTTVADRDTRCYNAMLHALAVHGHGRAALALFDTMCHEGVPADSVTMLAVMCACAHSGLVDEGQHYFDRMEVEFCMAPRIEHYGCMVDLLSRTGRRDDDEKVIQGMDVAPNAAMYRSLIQACGVHGNHELGERMIHKLIGLESDHSGNYVMLSNFYARMSRWNDAEKVRKEMKAMGIDKSPGSSVLDIDGILHEFLMGDKTHPGSTQIYAMVEEIEARLSEYGRRPSTAATLFDVEEEDKADALSYHSKRLAIAYALIASAPSGSSRTSGYAAIVTRAQSLSLRYMEGRSS